MVGGVWYYYLEKEMSRLRQERGEKLSLWEGWRLGMQRARAKAGPLWGAGIAGSESRRS